MSEKLLERRIKDLEKRVKELEIRLAKISPKKKCDRQCQCEEMNPGGTD